MISLKGQSEKAGPHTGSLCPVFAAWCHRSGKTVPAVELPFRWAPVSRLLDGCYAATPLVFRDEEWWLFTGNAGPADELHARFPDHQSGRWAEQSASPTAEGDANLARPGGCAPLLGEPTWPRQRQQGQNICREK
jgi:hypothetical protein